jgi:uncharacterized protein (DUF2384 family)
MTTQAFQLLDGEKADLIEEARDVLGDDEAESWFDLKNYQLGGHKPRDLICSGDSAKEQLVRDLLRSIKHGMTT